MLAAQVAAKPLPEGSDGTFDVNKALAASAYDCPAQNASMPSAGGGWWANQRGWVSPTLLVLALLALGTGALLTWGWRRRIPLANRWRDRSHGA
jgi:hypothetical protein